MAGKDRSVRDVAAENLGPVLETYGGKSLKRIITIGAAVFVCGVTIGIIIRSFGPDYFGPGMFVVGVGTVIALGYVRTSWESGVAKFEVCEGGVRMLLIYCDWVTELPWDRIQKVKIGKFKRVKGWPEHVVIRTTDGKDIEMIFGFWASVGTSRFSTIIHKFVEDVEDDVEFR